jgi:hypothetical protein
MDNAKVAKITPPVAINAPGIAQYQCAQNDPAFSYPLRPGRYSSRSKAMKQTRLSD